MIKREFVRNYSVYFTGAMVVALVNYLFYPVLARVMAPAGFGEVQALVSLYTEFAVITGALSIVVLHIVASPGEAVEKSRIITELRRLVRVGALAVALALALASAWLAAFFNIASPYSFVALGLLLFFATLPLFANAYLQGTFRYVSYSTAALIGAGARIVGAVAMVGLGFGVPGAILGIAAAQLVVWAYARYAAGGAPELAPAAPAGASLVERPAIARELRYGGLVLATNISLTILYTADILVVKHYFDPATAGLYAGVSALAKIGYFALAPLATVILPSVANGADTRRDSLKTAAIIFSALAIPGLLLSYLLHGQIVTVLFGAPYAPLSGLLPLATLLMVAVAFAQVFAAYFLALRRVALLWVAPVAVLVGVALSGLFHQSISAVLLDLLAGAAVAIFGLLILYAKEHLNRHTGT